MNTGLFLKTGLCGVIITLRSWTYICLIRINLTGEVCCLVYWGLWLWFKPSTTQSRNSLTAITAYLLLPYIGWLHDWYSLCYESKAAEKAKSYANKIVNHSKRADLFKPFWASDVVCTHDFILAYTKPPWDDTILYVIDAKVSGWSGRQINIQTTLGIVLFFGWERSG